MIDIAFDCSKQFILGKRLSKILFRTNNASTSPVEQPILAREHDHRNILEDIVMFDQGACLVAIEPRHHNIDENHIRMVIGNLRQCFEAICGSCDFTPCLLQKAFSCPSDSFTIIDDHDLHTGDVHYILITAHIKILMSRT